MPEASLTGQIAKRCRARTKHGQGASRQASILGRDCKKYSLGERVAHTGVRGVEVCDQ
ncbi:hypothetical protein GCM10010191_95340 [Actinomadura vinacea]|uniref:Uncharacterized protein n=1 Tax=Actinomadura vinacea TaxID=115336 RepID=A0ABN3KHY9_9ACTN